MIHGITTEYRSLLFLLSAHSRHAAGSSSWKATRRLPLASRTDAALVLDSGFILIETTCHPVSGEQGISSANFSRQTFASDLVCTLRLDFSRSRRFRMMMLVVLGANTFDDGNVMLTAGYDTAIMRIRSDVTNYHTVVRVLYYTEC